SDHQQPKIDPIKQLGNSSRRELLQQQHRESSQVRPPARAPALTAAAIDDNSSISDNNSSKSSSRVRPVYRRKHRTTQTKQSSGQGTPANPFFPQILELFKMDLDRSVQVCLFILFIV
ncbi:hypothetical protein MTR67_044765, partial [Solanum verrucosum]